MFEKTLTVEARSVPNVVFSGDADSIVVPYNGHGSSRSATLYYHYPCFDGLVSAAMAWDFLEHRASWQIEHAEAVNYDVARTWTAQRLRERSAVVDFLYHPQATFWADHHPTTFVDGEFSAVARTDRMLLYDSASPSCASLLWHRFGETLSDPRRFADMAGWADRIDAARYESVHEALFGDEPALTINTSLLHDADSSYGAFVLAALRARSLVEVANAAPVRSRAEQVWARTQRGLELVRTASVLRPGSIATFSVAPDRDAVVNRYSAYAVYPDARYSVALVRENGRSKITAMRNPWRDFESVHLGGIFRSYGGGGHQRVASVLVPQGDTNPTRMAERIIDEIRLADEATVATADRPA